MGNSYSQLKAAISSRRKSQVINPKVPTTSEGWSDKARGRRKSKSGSSGSGRSSGQNTPRDQADRPGAQDQAPSAKEPNAIFAGGATASGNIMGSQGSWREGSEMEAAEHSGGDLVIVTPRDETRRITPRGDGEGEGQRFLQHAGSGVGSQPVISGEEEVGSAAFNADGQQPGSARSTPRTTLRPPGVGMPASTNGGSTLAPLANPPVPPRPELAGAGGGGLVPRPPLEKKQLAPTGGGPAFNIPSRTHHYLPQMPKRWKKGDSIGAGSFGNVFLGLNSDTGELLAVKEVAVNTDASKMQESIQQLESEVALLSRLNNPHIVRYVGTIREDKKLYIFLEYVPGGSISSLLGRFGRFEESVIQVYTKQILLGLKYLHDQRTVHRDIKGANILVEKSGRIKLADFGMAKTLAEHMSYARSFKGSAYWMAPEVIRQKGHGVAADIWSVGCTVLEMATGQPPWSQCSTQVQAIFKIASSGDLPAIPEKLSPEATEFILLCLQRDPSSRPTADTLLAHKFVCDVDLDGAMVDEYGGGSGSFGAAAAAGGGGLGGGGAGGVGGGLGGVGGGVGDVVAGAGANGGGGAEELLKDAGDLDGMATSKGLLVGAGGGGIGAPLGAIGEDEGGAGGLGGMPLPPGSAVGGGRGATPTREPSESMLEDSLDFDEEPQHFRVRGLLGLPPVQLPAPSLSPAKGADLPPLDMRGKGS